MFTVQGIRRVGELNVPYAVVIDGEGEPLLGRFTGGSETLAALADADAGQTFRLPPVGPDFELDVDDPWTILQWLRVTTTITAVDGDLPDEPAEDADAEPVPADAVF
ncbi:hypothetical protein [Phycicoccus sp.]|uniref:hypothetical protein n=1 Tax=Phycicoccus sp. TaxID=1902410 RepID=UPI002BF33B39|nr:hypothetical protein [Phycicoccus sp.]HMM95388.1 hypothetical protein [Phycicoccus sp.]